MNKESWDGFRAHYVALWPEVKRLPACQWAVDPNAFDWASLMSPIELIVWGHIRDEGLVMYPQHPVAGYFVDFGHPKVRVAIECDGKQFHLDKAKDAQRQAAIEAKGWMVYRLTGNACTIWHRERTDDEGELYEPPSPALELVRRLGVDYGLSSRLMRQAA
jgi:very-short-patch-repair endonuclease